MLTNQIPRNATIAIATQILKGLSKQVLCFGIFTWIVIILSIGWCAASPANGQDADPTNLGPDRGTVHSQQDAAAAGQATSDKNSATADTRENEQAAAGTDESSTEVANTTDEPDLPLAEQKTLVESIYKATHTAKTAKDYTAFLEQCRAALDQKLSPHNRAYVVSLTGWAHNRRGETRLELARQLKSIDNPQYESALQQAMEDFDQALIADSDRERSWISRGIAHVFDENYESAISDFTAVIKLKPDSANGWFNRAEALYHLASSTRPESIIESEKASGSGKAQVGLNPLPPSEIRRMSFAQAVSDYDVVLRLNSDDPQALTGRGHANFGLGEYKNALADYSRVLELQAANDIAWVNRGDANQRLGDWSAAQSDYKKALSLNESGVACQRFAWLLATCPDKSVRNSSQAMEFVKRAIELAGESTTNFDTLAAAEAAIGDYETAKSTQQKVIGLATVEMAIDGSPYQARLALYENGEPYQQAEPEQAEPEQLEPKESDSNQATDEPSQGGKD